MKSRHFGDGMKSHRFGRGRRVKPRGFDRVAPFYTALEALAFGPWLQRCRLAFLAEAAVAGQVTRVLTAGEGAGRFLPACLAACPEAGVDCLDASAAMLARAAAAARRTPGDGARARFHHLSLPGQPLPGTGYDLIATHFFLDCFGERELGAVVDGLAAAAAPEARWLVSDFHIPDQGWRRQASRAIVAGLYAFFRRLAGLQARALIDPSPRIASHGFRLRRRRLFLGGLLKSELWIREGRG